MNLSFLNRHFKLFISIFILSIILFSGNIFLADSAADTSYGLDTTAEAVTPFKAQVGGDENFLQTRTGQLIGYILSFVGVLFLLLMIYAGLTWMTAGGNQEQIKKARSLMINAVLGLIIVLGAYAITAFIGQQLMN